MSDLLCQLCGKDFLLTSEGVLLSRAHQLAELAIMEHDAKLVPRGGVSRDESHQKQAGQRQLPGHSGGPGDDREAG